jgi:hypothetical protein
VKRGPSASASQMPAGVAQERKMKQQKMMKGLGLKR